MRKFLIVGKETGTNYREAVICDANNEAEAGDKAYEYFKSLKWELGIDEIYSHEVFSDNVRKIN